MYMYFPCMLTVWVPTLGTAGETARCHGCMLCMHTFPFGLILKLFIQTA